MRRRLPRPTAAVSQLALFAVFSVCLFTFGVGVADDRGTPWDPYVRTLPVGAGPRIVARLLNGVLFALLGLVPLLGLVVLVLAMQLGLRGRGPVVAAAALLLAGLWVAAPPGPWPSLLKQYL